MVLDLGKITVSNAFVRTFISTQYRNSLIPTQREKKMELHSTRLVWK